VPRRAKWLNRHLALFLPTFRIGDFRRSMVAEACPYGSRKMVFCEHSCRKPHMNQSIDSQRERPSVMWKPYIVGGIGGFLSKSKFEVSG